MITKTNAKAIKNKLYLSGKIEDVLYGLRCNNIKYVSNKEYWTCSNPDGDNPAAVVVKNNSYVGVTNYTRKFKNNADIIDFIRYSKNCGFKHAISFIESILGSDNDWEDDELKFSKEMYEDESEETTEGQAQSCLDEKELNKYSSLLFIEWYKDGVMPWARNKFDIRYDYRNKQVIIPIRDHKTGQLLAINARTTNELWEELGIPKYNITKGYLKHRNVYGLWENRGTILQAGYAVIYEGERSVLKRFSLNDATGLAIQGHSLSDEQADILTDLNVDLVVSMDADIAEDEVRSICSKLCTLIQKKGLQTKVYYTFDRNNLMGEKESLADQPRKIYDVIFNEKVLFDVVEQKRYYTAIGKMA